jgi:hypothetical protein
MIAPRRGVGERRTRNRPAQSPEARAPALDLQVSRTSTLTHANVETAIHR